MRSPHPGGGNTGASRKGPGRLRLVQASESREQVFEAELMPRPAELHLVLPEPDLELTGVLQEEDSPVAVPSLKPEVAFYRKYTEAMLRRYSTMSMEAGRVPSLLGRELFRGNVSSYKVHSFEDVVIYVHDVETCLKRLEPGQQHLVRRIALQGYTQGEASAMLGITLRTVVRRYAEALDRLTRLFLRRGMLEPRLEYGETGGAE